MTWPTSDPAMTALASLDGCRVLVTGASSGIGALLGPMLAERGASVGLVARRGTASRRWPDACRRHGGGHRTWAVDLADPSRAAALGRGMGGVRPPRRGRQQRAPTDAPTRRPPRPRHGRGRDVHQLPVAGGDQPRRTPPHGRRDRGRHRERLEPRRSPRHPPRIGLLRVEVRPVRLVRSDGHGPVDLTGRDPPHHPRRHRHRDLGPTRQRPRRLRRTLRTTGDRGPGDLRGDRGRRFRVVRPRHEGGGRVQDIGYRRIPRPGRPR